MITDPIDKLEKLIDLSSQDICTPDAFQGQHKTNPMSTSKVLEDKRHLYSENAYNLSQQTSRFNIDLPFPNMTCNDARQEKST
jgi:hypothetical protein